MENNSMEIDSYHDGSSSQHHDPSPLPPTLANHSWQNLPFPKKTRGRPAGSKNKPKSTFFRMEPNLSNPSSNIIEINITPGKDIIETILDAARQSHYSFTILSAYGMITNVNLHTSPNSAALTPPGPYTLLSLTGSYIYKNQYKLHLGATSPPPLYFGINLCTSQGQVFGGPIVGSVVAGENVSLMVSTFRYPMIYKHLPQCRDGDNLDNNDSH